MGTLRNRLSTALTVAALMSVGFNTSASAEVNHVEADIGLSIALVDTGEHPWRLIETGQYPEYGGSRQGLMLRGDWADLVAFIVVDRKAEPFPSWVENILLSGSGKENLLVWYSGGKSYEEEPHWVEGSAQTGSGEMATILSTPDVIIAGGNRRDIALGFYESGDQWVIVFVGTHTSEGADTLLKEALRGFSHL